MDLMRHLPIIDLLVILLYFAGTMGLGLYFMRRSRDPEAFMAAERSLPSWLVGMSIFATYVSSISFLAIPGNAYQFNWSRFTFSLSIPFAALVGSRFFVPLYRARAEVSAYSYLEHRFGPLARSYAAAFYLLTQIVRMGSVMYLMALPFNSLLGWDIKTIILVTGISTTLYAMLGGIKGVIWTDAIQGFMLIGGALLCAVLMFFGMPEGPGQIFSLAREHNKFSLGSFNLFDWTSATFWVILLNGVFMNLQNFGIDQNYVQRYITARTDKQAHRALWLGSLLYVPVSLIFFFIGTELYAYYTAQPALLPAGMQAEGMADRVFPYFIVTGLPVGVTGLLIAAVFAAAMSTIATSLNSSATVVLTDFYKRHFRKNAGEKESMRVLYATSFLWGVMGMAVAMAMINVKSALDTWWTLSSIFSGGMLGLFLLGYFARRATKTCAAAGMAFGLLIITWMSLSQMSFWRESTALRSYSSPFHSFLIIVFGTLAIFLVGFLICLPASLKKKHSSGND